MEAKLKAEESAQLARIKSTLSNAEVAELVRKTKVWFFFSGVYKNVSIRPFGVLQSVVYF
jgi:hypothetical protein